MGERSRTGVGIGFDDIALAPYTIPALSSVKIPVTEMIQETIGRLIFMLGDGAFTPSKTFTGELIGARLSCAARFALTVKTFVIVTSDDDTPFFAFFRIKFFNNSKLNSGTICVCFWQIFCHCWRN